MPRAVLPEVAHHLTHRGVNREPIFIEDFDRHVYVDLVAKQAKRFQVTLFGHCLMSNHVHWIAVPEEVDSLAKAFGEAHGRYAQDANARLGSHGHFWQDRFFSCGLDAGHRLVALRYVERNPVRARLVEAADQWPWSSATVHVGRQRAPSWMSRVWRSGLHRPSGRCVDDRRSAQWTRQVRQAFSTRDPGGPLLSRLQSL
ncbi:MAG: transposase [Bryobacteraceae bacterium]